MSEPKTTKEAFQEFHTAWRRMLKVIAKEHALFKMVNWLARILKG